MLQIRENSVMSQHPVIFIGSLRCHAAVLSVAFLDREKEKNRHAGGKNRGRYRASARVPFRPHRHACDRQN